MEATESKATTKMDIVDTNSNSNGNSTVKEIVMEDDTAVEKENVGFVFPLPKDRKPTASEKANVGFVFPAPQDPKPAASQNENVGFFFPPRKDPKPTASLESSPLMFHPGPGVPIPVPVDRRRRPDRRSPRPRSPCPASSRPASSRPHRSRRRSGRRRSTVQQGPLRRSARLAGRQPAASRPTNADNLKHERDIFFDETQNTRRNKRRKVVLELQLQPSFAMLPNDFEQGKILDTGYGGEWEFELGHWLSHIHRQYPTLDLYVVGYRVEERPGINERGFREAFPDVEEGKRINVPYCAVHALPRELEEPDTIVLEDIGEERKHELKKLSDLSLHWKQVAVFEDSPTSPVVVKLLISNEQTTIPAQRASFLPGADVGGRVYFPQRRSYAENHGEDFHFEFDGGDFPFNDEIWGWTKHHVRIAIKNGVADDQKNAKWRAFMMTEDTNHWVESVLPTALDRFYIYHDEGIDRGKSEIDVRKKLREVFTNYRLKLHNDNHEYKEFAQALDQCKNFKIYPENQFLHNYLGKEGVNKLWKWTPGNDEVVVYPTVERMAEPEPASIWG